MPNLSENKDVDIENLLKEELPNIVEEYNKLKNISVNSNCWTYQNWDKVQKEDVIEKLKDKKAKLLISPPILIYFITGKH